jgi:hypothetical protein
VRRGARPSAQAESGPPGGLHLTRSELVRQFGRSEYATHARRSTTVQEMRSEPLCLIQEAMRAPVLHAMTLPTDTFGRAAHARHKGNGHPDRGDASASSRISTGLPRGLRSAIGAVSTACRSRRQAGGVEKVSLAACRSCHRKRGWRRHQRSWAGKSRRRYVPVAGLR